MSNPIDFHFRGVVAIRLENAKNDDVRSVSMQLGQQPGAFSGPPDIVVKFTDRIVSPKLNYLGLNSAAFSGEQFYLVDARSGRIDVQIPFDRIGHGCAIEVRRDMSSIPLLADIISLTCQAKGYIALHGSAFSVNGRGILIVGWEKGGKTEALLSFMSNGARYVGDEVILLSPDGASMFGIPIPLAVWEWQFPYISDLLPKRRLGQKLVFGCIRFLDAINARFGQGRLRKWLPFSVLRKALPTLKRQLRNWYRPDELFAGRMGDDIAPVHAVFHVVSATGDQVVVEPCDPQTIAARMRSSNEFERTHLFQYYRAFKYAFPERRNPLLEQLDERQAQALREALVSQPAWTVTHPYPVALDELYARMRPFVEDAHDDAAH